MPRMRPYTTLPMYGQALCALAENEIGSLDSFERNMAEYFGTAHAIAMPLARVAIYFAIKHLVRPGQEVILSPYTISDVVNMVVCAGAIPVFADIERDTCNIAPDAIERLITPRTGAIMITHFYGLACDMDRMVHICESHNLPLIEDAAQAFGCRFGGKRVGGFGRVGIFSFGLQKNVTAFMGGLLVTPDGDLAMRIRADIDQLGPLGAVALLKKIASGAARDILTWPPLFSVLTYRLFRWAYLNDIGAINNRMAIDLDPKLKTQIPEGYLRRLRPFQGALVEGQLATVDLDTHARINAAKLYHEALDGLEGLILPPLKTDGSHIYGYFTIQHEHREDLARAVTRSYRDIQVSHHRNCSSLPCFSMYAKDCPNAEHTARTLVYLPTYRAYGLDEVRRTAVAVRAFVQG